VLDGYGNPVLVPVGAPPPGPWNTAVALPSIMLAAASLNAAPATLSNQQCAVIRYALNASASSLAQLLLSLRSPAVAVPGLATLRIGESLQDLATRTTGDFENWPAIAALNALSPPYPGMSNTTLALKGAALLLPPASGTVVAGGPAPSYFANVLGTDWDFGPINGPMPPWIGDIPLITGYLNFARAIGRRLQTTLGTLIYHPSYGSRIPPEVGAVQGIDEAPRLRQYGDSAITLDPRTGSILSSIATTQPGWLATYSAVVQPIGPGSNAVSVNETLSPLL